MKVGLVFQIMNWYVSMFYFIRSFMSPNLIENFSIYFPQKTSKIRYSQFLLCILILLYYVFLFEAGRPRGREGIIYAHAIDYMIYTYDTVSRVILKYM